MPFNARGLESIAADTARECGGFYEYPAVFDESPGVERPAVYRYQIRLPAVPWVLADEQHRPLVGVIGESLYLMVFPHAGIIHTVGNGLPVGAFAELVQSSSTRDKEQPAFNGCDAFEVVDDKTTRTAKFKTLYDRTVAIVDFYYRALFVIVGEKPVAFEHGLAGNLAQPIRQFQLSPRLVEIVTPKGELVSALRGRGRRRRDQNIVSGARFSIIPAARLGAHIGIDRRALHSRVSNRRDAA